MEHKKKFLEVQAKTLIENLKKKNMDGIYFETAAEAAAYAMAQIPSGSKVAVGGTQSLDWMGMKKMLEDRDDITALLRHPQMSGEEIRRLYLDSFSADIYFMSTNAMTMQGELVNIDGRGNRVAALCYGPDQVYIIAGMNKVCPDLESAKARARNVASIANCIRLNRKTPCVVTGRCQDCSSPDNICSQFVYTRNSGIPGRIHVILVGEELGY